MPITTQSLDARRRWTITGIKAVHSVIFLVNSDIFLPRPIADRIPIIFGPPLVIGVGLLAARAALQSQR